MDLQIKIYFDMDGVYLRCFWMSDYLAVRYYTAKLESLKAVEIILVFKYRFLSGSGLRKRFYQYPLTEIF